MTICADVLSIHYDPEIWGPTDPNVFYPPRFSPEIKRNPVAYLGFGVGPRNWYDRKTIYKTHFDCKILIPILKN
jgi:hypothetical protein